MASPLIAVGTSRINPDSVSAIEPREDGCIVHVEGNTIYLPDVSVDQATALLWPAE